MEKPVLDGGGGVEYTVVLYRASYVTLRGLTITGGLGIGHRGGGIMVDHSTQIELRDNEIRDNRAYGVRLHFAADVTVQGNDIFGNAVGVHAGSNGDGIVILRNLVHDNDQMMVNTPDIAGDDVGGEGIAIVNGTGNVVVAENRLWGNRAISYDFGYDGGAFSVYAASNWTFRDNVAWDNRNVLETGTNGARTPCDGGSFVRNLAYGANTIDRSVGMVLRCASNTVVANNTFYGLQYFAFSISHMSGAWGGSIDGLRVVNNVATVNAGVVYSILTTMPVSVQLDNNVLHNSGSAALAMVRGTTTNDLAAFQALTGQEQQGFAGDPLVQDASTNEFFLRPESPAIDRGTTLPGLTDGFVGLAPDCGYSEFVLRP